VAVAFDTKEKTFRHQMYSEYKAKRLSPPEELLQQIPHIREYLELRGIDCFEAPGFEADDIIARISNLEKDKGHQVFIFTSDKDLFQLVGDQVFIFHPKLKKKMDADSIKEMFGVFPNQVVDYLSLVGDSSDNIPGVPGIGDKTAKKLIDKFGSLDHLLDKIDEAEEKIKHKINTHMDLLQMSQKLVNLNDIPDFNLFFPLARFENKIKIDRFFISQVDQDLKKKNFLAQIIKMAEVQGAKVVAEGVENEMEYIACREAGCKLAQGYYIRRPDTEITRLACL